MFSPLLMPPCIPPEQSLLVKAIAVAKKVNADKEGIESARSKSEVTVVSSLQDWFP